MAVGLSPPRHLAAVAGVTLASVRAIKSRSRDDLSVIHLCEGARVAAVFTQSRFPAAPVVVCQDHLSGASGASDGAAGIRALAINAGIANAGTLGSGLKDARHSCRLLAARLRCRPRQVLPFSTGVIMERLPMDNYAKGLRSCVAGLHPDKWLDVASAICTTDTVIKGKSARVGAHTVTGIAKGSGMIHPDMRTMLAFVATDADLPAATLAAWQRRIVRDSFNAISVDGDTSTNDSFALIATGKSGRPQGRAARDALFAAVAEVCGFLAEAIVRDGEGASKLIVLTVSGGASRRVCRAVAQSVATSPLVKTALAAGDANVGRLLMAIGKSSAAFDPAAVTVRVGGVPTIRRGGIDARYDESAAAAALAQDCVPIEISLGGGGAHSIVFKTCDLTHRYIEINADYRS